MSNIGNCRFRPTLERLEAREVLSANFGAAPVGPPGATQGQQANNSMQVNYNAVFNNAADALATQQVSVVNGVADVTQAAKAILESDIRARIPESLGKYPLVGEVKLDGVALNRLTLDKDGNFNGQLTVTFKYQMAGTQYAAIQVNIKNNQLSLETDNALVRQFGKLEQRQREWQPQVTAALDGLRSRLMPVYFGAQANAVNGR